MHFVMQRAALTLHLTTRMPVLWMRVGMRGTGIGVVFGGLPSPLSTLQVVNCPQSPYLFTLFALFSL